MITEQLAFDAVLILSNLQPEIRHDLQASLDL